MTVPLVEDVWQQRARDTRQPLWLRVYAVAEAYHSASGHCPLYLGELRERLGDGTLTASAISRAISKAVEQGWLHPSSSARCLLLTTATRDLDCLAPHRTRSR